MVGYDAKAERKAQFDQRAADRKAKIQSQAQASNVSPPPQSQPIQSSAQPAPGSSGPELIRNADPTQGAIGKITGVTLPNGRTVRGSDREIRALLETRNQYLATPPGAVEGSQVQAQNNYAQALQGQVGQVGQVSPEQIANAGPPGVSGQAVSYGVAGIGAASGIAGAVGAGTAEAGAVGAGTAAGVIPGLVIAAAALTKIGAEKHQEVATDYAQFMASTKYMEAIMNRVNHGLESPSDAIIEWNNELAKIYNVEQALKQETNNSLSSFLSGGRRRLVKIETYKQNLPYLNQQLQQALLNPNPNSLSHFAETTDLQDTSA